MRPACCPATFVPLLLFITLSAGDIKRGMVSSGSDKLSASQLGPAVFKQYQEVVSELMRQSTPRIVVDGLDPQFWRGQVRGSAWLGALLLTACACALT
jgi:hypothetical protein